MRCGAIFRQFYLLLWKNFVLQIRRPIGTIFELILPIAAVACVVVLRVFSDTTDNCFVTFEPDTLQLPPVNAKIFYSPNNTDANEIMRLVKRRFPQAQLAPYTSEEDMINGIRRWRRNYTDTLKDFFEENTDADDVLRFDTCINGYGVLFDNLDGINIEYTIRPTHEVKGEDDEPTWNTDIVQPRFQIPGPRVSPNLYLSEGFLHFQNLLGMSIIEWRVNKSAPGNDFTEIPVNTKQFPYPPQTHDPFLENIEQFLSLLLVLGLMWSAGIFPWELIAEKQTRMRESMKMMGLSNWILWLTWYLKQFLFLLISIIVMTILLKIQVFKNSNPILLLIFLILFVNCLIAQSFLISVFFSRAILGLLFGFLFWFKTLIPYLFISDRYEQLNTGEKILACFLSNTCMGLGVNVISTLEIRGEGVQGSNIGRALSEDDSFNLAVVYGMLILDSIIYMLIAWYIDAVFPGQYGIPKPFYFFLTPSYWLGRPIGQVKSVTSGSSLEMYELLPEQYQYSDGNAHEAEPTDLQCGISVKGLTKVYKSNIVMLLSSLEQHHDVLKAAIGKKVAVDNLYLNMYQDQITVLLGHNGAGKTTTMSMLVGLFPPTSGNAIINGHSIINDIDGVRESLGLCPQHNVLFSRLTVREHLTFFARLKGISSRKVKEEVNSMIEDLQLQDKANQRSAALSGGQQRKLSVGIALVANSKFVILDEPTSGMDPYARRATWDLLSKHKKGRTILLTTHFMDEADLLGDRIAIMAEGQLRCSGSSLFLKSRYGVGYHMVVTKEDGCNTAVVIQCVTNIILSSKMLTDVGKELSFILPSNAASQFHVLFTTLENNKGEYGISGFGVSVTTMEEVFMKVGEGSSKLEDIVNEGKKKQTMKYQVLEDTVEDITTETHDKASAGLPSMSQSDHVLNIQQLNIELNTGIVLWLQQFYGLLIKRFLHSLRNWRAIITQLIMPVIFIILGLVLVYTVPGINSLDPKRSLSLRNSGIDDEDIRTFYAECGNGNPIFQGMPIPDADIAEDIADDVERIVNRTRNNNFSTPSDCCNYRYQILDTFCATQTPDELRSVCSGRGDFGYSRCLSTNIEDCEGHPRCPDDGPDEFRYHCLQCRRFDGDHLATCTYPITMDNQHYEDSPYCPYPPSVSINKSLPILEDDSEPLDFMSYFVDERLMEMAESEGIVEFFRKYMAGFVISKRESAVSHCGLVDDDDIGNNRVGDLMCLMLSTTPVVRNEPLFADSIARQEIMINDSCYNRSMDAVFTYERTVSCSLQRDLIFRYDYDPTIAQYPNCNNVTLDFITFSLEQNVITNFAMIDNNFEVDGIVKQVVNPIIIEGGNELVGRIYAPYGKNTENMEMTRATVFYNNQPFHMPAAALNAFHTVYLRHSLRRANAENADKYSINVNIHPLPRTDDGEAEAADKNFLGFLLSIKCMFGLSFLAASFILYHSSKAKHIQFVSGVHITSFWLSAYVWDLINSLVPIIAAVVLFAAFPIDSYRENIGSVFLLFFFFCWSTIPLVYLISFLFKLAPVAFAITFLLYFFTALAALLVVFFLNEDDSEIAHYFLIALPNYAFAEAIGQIHTNHVIREACEEIEPVCESRGIVYTDNILDFKYPGIGANLLAMVLGGIVYFIITLLCEQNFFMRILARLFIAQTATRAEIYEHEDSDVAQEKTRMNSGQLGSDLIQLKNLKKVYGELYGYLPLHRCRVNVKHAVNGLSLGIPKGECFGLLGVNGAGKTTTFKMLTGDIRPSSGTATIAGYDIISDIRQVQQHIGYCPQFDALIDDMTAYELLWMYARLRGIPERKIREAVDIEIKRLDLQKHANNRCGTYSGGNKRKLSTAVGLVGNPQIVLLDEPTTGMDPVTRRNLWNALITVIKAGKSIVLTSHSMEECEALCTRLAIMVNGEFKCLGGTQHLKSKYGCGATLQVKIGSREDFIGSVQESMLTRDAKSSSLQPTGSPPPDQPSSPRTQSPPPPGVVIETTTNDGLAVQNFMNFIENSFERALLIEQHLGSITYQLGGQNLSWSYIFHLLEENKERLSIVEYSVSQTTLERVFINFAKDQKFEE